MNMNENFHLVAPRATMKSAWGGLIVEPLFYGAAHELVRLLAVPVLPTTPLPTGTPASIRAAAGEDFYHRLTCQIARILGVPAPALPMAPLPSSPSSSVCMPAGESQQSQPQIGTNAPANLATDGAADADLAHQQPEHQRETETDDTTDRSVTFSSLPVEIHRLILAQCVSIEDVVRLSLTSRYFWTIGQEHMHRYFAAFLGPWAGKNIIIIGQGVKAVDFPPELSAAEEGELAQFRYLINGGYDINQHSYQRINDSSYSKGETPCKNDTWYRFGHHGVPNNKQSISPRSEPRCIWFVHDRSGAPKQVTRPTCRMQSGKLLVHDADYFPEDQPWILRNLTTKEFVRSEAIAIKPEFVHGPHIHGLGFGHVVAARIFWTKSPTSRIFNKTNISRGVWAGHRFDITTLTRHEGETNDGAGWTDVSQEVADELADIWGSRFGAKWREVVIKDGFEPVWVRR